MLQNDMTEIKNAWLDAYSKVAQQLNKMSEVDSVVTAFNTNIDAVLKISGKQIEKLALDVGLTANDLQKVYTTIAEPKDVVRGIIKCFTGGIAEEWLCKDKKIYNWMRDNLSYDHLQMGGQAGIVANVMAVSRVKKVVVHTNSHPFLQASQFLDSDNLYGIDENNILMPAHKINRELEDALIHWIIEFDAGDEFVFDSIKYCCPKANRFIATYDPANMALKINSGFVEYVQKNGYDYLILSGYHSLTAYRGGCEKIAQNVLLLQQWKKLYPNGIIHLELASTQDKAVRAAIIEKIAPLVDSIGLNERESLDALEIVDEKLFAKVKNKKLSVPMLFDILKIIKDKTKTPRVQLHMFGLYITMQNKGFTIAPEANKRGMILAATVAAAKCSIGKLENYADLLVMKGNGVSNYSIKALNDLADYLKQPELIYKGITLADDEEIIAVPTILVDKPVTLVGMGDTISSVSLVGAR